jgi:hypothetical protein
MFDERRRRQIPEDFGAGRNALCFQPSVWNALTHVGTFLFQMFKAAATGGPAAAYVCIAGAYNPEKVARSKQDSAANHRCGGR